MPFLGFQMYFTTVFHAMQNYAKLYSLHNRYGLVLYLDICGTMSFYTKLFKQTFAFHFVSCTLSTLRSICWHICKIYFFKSMAICRNTRQLSRDHCILAFFLKAWCLGQAVSNVQTEAKCEQLC